MFDLRNPTRRAFLQHASFLAAAYHTPGLFAEELTRTPSIGEGPFYPDKLPLDTDNDLLILNNSITPAVGQITHLSGKITDTRGAPLRNAFVEIWQVDSQGAYLHTGSANRDKADKNFQGYGRFLTDHRGGYYFRTIRPVPYPGRTPHIHIAVSQNGRRLFNTQVLIKGEPQNERDGLYRSVRDPKLRQLLLADFAPLQGSKLNELAASFDIVVGLTPSDQEMDRIRGGIGIPDRLRRRRR